MVPELDTFGPNKMLHGFVTRAQSPDVRAEAGLLSEEGMSMLRLPDKSQAALPTALRGTPAIGQDAEVGRSGPHTPPASPMHTHAHKPPAHCCSSWQAENSEDSGSDVPSSYQATGQTFGGSVPFLEKPTPQMGQPC